MNRTLDLLKERIAALDERFRERTIRERAMLTAGVAACILLLIDHLAIQPVSRQRHQVQAASSQVLAEIADLNRELEHLTSIELTDEEKQRNDEIRQLREQLDQITLRLAREVDALVPPKAVVALLEEILAATPDLELIRVESQPPVRIGATNESTTEPEESPILYAGPRLYRHGLEIEVEGTYQATLDYVEKLETSSWKLLWDRLELEVTKFPTARVRIELHTISGDEEWVGV